MQSTKVGATETSEGKLSRRRDSTNGLRGLAFFQSMDRLSKRKLNPDHKATVQGKRGSAFPPAAWGIRAAPASEVPLAPEARCHDPGVPGHSAGTGLADEGLSLHCKGSVPAELQAGPAGEQPTRLTGTITATDCCPDPFGSTGLPRRCSFPACPAEAAAAALITTS